MFWSAYRSPSMLVAAAVLLTACSDVTEPAGASRRLGILQLEAYTGAVVQPGSSTRKDADTVRWDVAPIMGQVVWPPVVIDAPAVVDAGEPFTITVYTIGPNGCWRADGHELAVGGHRIEIRPYDAHSGAEACTGVLTFLPHAATVSVSEPGEWTVRVRGRRARHGDAVWETPVTAEQTIQVR